MSSTTINSSTHTAITLSTAYTTIDSGVLISIATKVAVGGPSTTSWTLVNDGSITAAANYGVSIHKYGTITNQSSGVISAALSGIIFVNGSGTVVNYGSVTGGTSSFGIELSSGSVTNKAAGSIRGGHGGVVVDQLGTVVNYGQISTNSKYGVTLGGAGLVTNAASATISSGGLAGVAIGTGSTVDNSGYIHGSTDGVYVGGNGTVYNFGTIAGGSYAIKFTTHGGLVEDNPGAAFIGTVAGFDGSGSMKLKLASGSAAGTVSGIGSSFTNFTSVIVDAGATWTVSGSNTISAGTVAANLTNAGRLAVTGSLYDTGAATGNGEIDIAAGAAVVLNSTVGAAQAIRFLANTGTLGIGNGTVFNATVYGVQSGDAIDFTSLAASGSVTAGVNSSHHLRLTQGGSLLASIALDPNQNFTGLYFDALANGSSVVVTATTTPCFCAGTRIRTMRGDVAVEDLREGDLVVTAAGRQRPIRWIGRRSYKGHFVRGNRDVLPIRIKAGALADNVPSRDLCVSPLHAMLVGGFLIPAFKLVNGVTIVQVQDAEEIHYFHIELATHDILLAEDAPTESFVDDDSRDLFHNAPEYWSKHPRQPWRPARFCAPRIEDGYELEDALHPLLIRAGLRDAWSSPYGDPLGELRGWVEECRPDRIAGWAQNMEFPHAGVVLSVFLGDEKLADIIANKQRADLEEAGIGDGRHAFEYRPKKPIPAERLHMVRVVRAMDRAALPGQTHYDVAA